jgi:hypothetical protein
MVYIPYGILCIALTILIMNSFKKVREIKKPTDLSGTVNGFKI